MVRSSMNWTIYPKSICMKKNTIHKSKDKCLIGKIYLQFNPQPKGIITDITKILKNGKRIKI